MRKILLLAIPFCFIGILSKAQVTKGSVLLGGDIGFTSNKVEIENASISYTNKMSSFTATPVFGKAIKDNLVVGIFAGATRSKSDQVNYGYDKSKGYNGGLFIRKYRSIGTSKFYLFLQGSAGGYYTESESYSRGSNNYSSLKTMRYNLNVYPGLSFAVSKKFHLETGFSNLLYAEYSHENRYDGSQRINDAFALGTSLNNLSNFYLGFRILLGK